MKPINNRSTTSAEVLIDLPVTDVQSQQITGGTEVIVGVGSSIGGHVKVFKGGDGSTASAGQWPWQISLQTAGR